MNFPEPFISKITSRENRRLKFVRSARDGREPEMLFIEGLRLGEEFLKTNLKIHSVFFTEKFAALGRGNEIINSLLSTKTDLFEVEEKIFGSLSDTKHSQGIIIIGAKPAAGKEIIESVLDENAFLLLLHQINNPSNLGAIFRTAEAAGARGIITTKGTSDVFSTKALRGAMGASFRLRCWLGANFFEVLQWAGDKNIKSIRADIKSQKSYTEIAWNEPKLVIFGSEGHGLTAAEQAATDESLVIPMENDVESLNVAVSCGIILFEARRQRELQAVKK